MFSLLSTFFFSALLRQGQFMQRIGKVERFKKELDSISKPTCIYKILRISIYRELVRDFIPKTLKARSRTILALASLVFFLKAKAHDSKNHLAANIFKSGFSEGE